MKVRSFIGRIVVGWVLIVLGALWCWDAKQVKASAETAAVGSFMFIGGVLAVRSGVENRRRVRELREEAAIWREGVGYPTSQGEEERAARRAASDWDLWGRG